MPRGLGRSQSSCVSRGALQSEPSRDEACRDPGRIDEKSTHPRHHRFNQPDPGASHTRLVVWPMSNSSMSRLFLNPRGWLYIRPCALSVGGGDAAVWLDARRAAQSFHLPQYPSSCDRSHHVPRAPALPIPLPLRPAQAPDVHSTSRYAHLDRAIFAPDALRDFLSPAPQHDPGPRGGLRELVETSPGAAQEKLEPLQRHVALMDGTPPDGLLQREQDQLRRVGLREDARGRLSVGADLLRPQGVRCAVAPATWCRGEKG